MRRLVALIVPHAAALALCCSSWSADLWSQEPPTAPPALTPPALLDDDLPAPSMPTQADLQRWFTPTSQIDVSNPAAPDDLLNAATHLFHKPGDARGLEPIGRGWASSEFNWAASELYALPTYWDEVPLERYGQTFGPYVQPFVSATRFYTNFLVMPYKMGIDEKHDHIYTLGYFRPGSPAPQVRQRLPWSWNGAIMEATTWVTFVYMLP